MSRPLKNTHRNRTCTRRSGTSLLSALTAAALGAALLPAVSLAAGYAYQQHTLNAGVLVYPNANGTTFDPAPYLFYVMNNRPDVRPPDLTLINPLAPPTVTPNTPSYWQVPLDTISDSELSQYNVLYLPANTRAFSPVINERLRRFVDNGGQLIVEYGQALSPAVAGLFTGTGPGQLTSMKAAAPFVGTSLLRHPIITQPYLLSDTDLAGLADLPGGTGFSYDVGVNTLDTVHGVEYTDTFSPILAGTTNTGTVTGALLTAAQIGAGQAVVSSLNLGGDIGSSTYGLTVNGVTAFNPINLYVPPVTDLKLLANILAWSETHPNENKTSHGNASNNGLAAFSPAWQYLLPPTTAATPPVPSGAAVWGNFVFAVDATNGTLHAFDAYPSENLTGATPSATGAEPGSSYPTTSYDEIWNNAASGSTATGKGASTPTVAAFRGVNYVFVEKQDGTVVAFNAVTGAAPTGFTLSGSGGGAFAGNAPGPTYYDGRIYAGQADGTLHVYDLNEGGAAAAVTLNSNQAGLSGGSSGEYVTGAPAAGTLASGDTSVLVAVVPTTNNIYSVLLGARNEALRQFETNGALAGYSINRLGHYDLNNIFADTGYASLLAYDYNGNAVTGVAANSTAPNPQDPLFAITNTLGYYTDWNMDFTAAAGNGTNPNPVNINYISADSYGELQSISSPNAAVSAPAIDRRGNYYYTETMQAGTSATGGSNMNSYVVGVANAPLHNNVHIKFRFRMPTTADGTAPLNWNYIDGDGVNYNAGSSSLLGYQFVGAPVIDDQGNVYVAAVKAGSGSGASATPSMATVLCFRGDQAVSVTAPAGSLLDLSQATITQPDEGGGDVNTIQRGPDAGVGAGATYGQYIAAPPPVNANGTATGPSTMTFYNFGKRGRTFAEIAGNLTEPQPVTANSTDGTSTQTTLSMQTNLAWFVNPFALTPPSTGTPAGSITGLSLVGSSLFLCDGLSLYRVSTNPQVGSSKIVNTPPTVTPIVTPITGAGGVSAGVGAVGMPPSIGGSVMVLNGTNGIAVRTRQATVIADNNRILGVDGDGSAVWSVDATTRTDLTQTPPVSMRVPFSHPTSLSAFAVNDYLVADTGTNRCVRFDTGGNVKWELTRFQDPSGLMAPGQPLTLNQPASVVSRTVSISSTATFNPGGTVVYYLVADSGNARVLEVADTFDVNGNLLSNGNQVLSHILTWVSHTGDQGGRRYRYGSATYYPYTTTNANGSQTQNLSIAATVTNTRLAPLVANPNTTIGGTLLGSASSDAPGGSIVVFNYPLQQGAAPYNNLANVPNDLAYTTAGFYTASSGTGTTYTPYTIRNPRFLEFYTPTVTTAAPAANVASFNFLYADDNGVFDLSYDTARGAFVAGADRLHFRPSDYHAMTTPTDAPTAGASGATYDRSRLPFVPTCVQALSTDSQTVSGTPGSGSGGSANVTRRYLITQNYSQGELGTPPAANGTVAVNGRIGGEIFEIDVAAALTYPASSVSGVIPPPTVTGTAYVTAPGGFGSVLIPGTPASGNTPATPAANTGSTLSHPALTGPLTQPTFAVRLP